MSETITIKNNNKKENIKDLSGLTQKIKLQSNKDILIDILDILNSMNDRLKDIELNNRAIYLYVKRDKENKKEGWIF
tara:strand:+ start:1161 stop:1391 length:231 start_codon:yes stop_codon:yes gene_type:complete